MFFGNFLNLERGQDSKGAPVDRNVLDLLFFLPRGLCGLRRTHIGNVEPGLRVSDSKTTHIHSDRTKSHRRHSIGAVIGRKAFRNPGRDG